MKKRIHFTIIGSKYLYNYGSSNWFGKNVRYANVLSKVIRILGIVKSFSPGNAIAYVIDSIDDTGRNDRLQL